MGLSDAGTETLEALSLTLPSDVRATLDVPLDPVARERALDAIVRGMAHCDVPEIEIVLAQAAWQSLSDRQFRIASHVFWQGRAATTSLV